MSSVVKARHNLLKAMREFFYARSYLEVETPNIVKTVPPDPYIDPLKVFIEGKAYYLHTSPEMGMKKLLQFGHERIFEICKVYRAEELKEIHSIEFTMLEWYREGTYSEAMEEVEEMVRYIANRLFKNKGKLFKRPFKTYDLEGLFLETCDINPFPVNRDELFNIMKSKGFGGIDEKDTWNDLFFKLLIQEVEPKIKEQTHYFIKDWPLSIPTMAKRKGLNKVERFELYIGGMEIANGYTELFDPEEQRDRFIVDNLERERLGKNTFGTDESFLEALSKIKGPYAGISLGVDRLLMVLLDKKRIDDVMAPYEFI